jgi:hypothetical protein
MGSRERERSSSFEILSEEASIVALRQHTTARNLFSSWLSARHSGDNNSSPSTSRSPSIITSHPVSSVNGENVSPSPPHSNESVSKLPLVKE